MSCTLSITEQEELLLGYCASTLDVEKARTFERHIQICPDCQSMVQMQKSLDETLNDWIAPDPGQDFDRKLMARIEAEKSTNKMPFWEHFLTFNFGWKPLIPLAMVSLALIFFLVRQPAGPDVAAQKDSIRAEEIEQVERALDDIEALQALHQPDTPQPAKESL